MLIYESLVVTSIAYCVLCGLSRRFSTRRAAMGMAVAAMAVYATWGLVRYAHAPLRPLLVVLAGTWVFLGLLALVVGLPWLIIRGLIRVLRRCAFRRPATTSEPLQSRRDFLGTVALPTVAVSLGGLGSLRSLTELVVVERTLRIRNWPKALDGFRIGQITDTHVGDFIGPGWVAHGVRLLNAAQVHLQVMTGDLLDDLHFLEPSFAALESCQAPLGMLCVLGNHEKMRRRLKPILAAYRARRATGRLRLLVDESEVLEHNGARLQVVGVDYPMHVNGQHMLPKMERLQLMQSSAEKGFASVSRDQPLICLSHHPDFFPFAQARGAQLTLSGHTHGGQIALLGRPLISPYRFMYGQYQLGDSHLYVSGGAGHWLPLRYGVPLEVAVITLRSG
jgi:uncharacterized protein